MSTRKTTAQKIAEAQAKKQEQQNELKRLLQQQKAEENKAKTKRHTERGAIAEKLLDPKAQLTNEEFQKRLEDILKAYNSQNQNSQTNGIISAKSDIPKAENETE